MKRLQKLSENNDHKDSRVSPPKASSLTKNEMHHIVGSSPPRYHPQSLASELSSPILNSFSNQALEKKKSQLEYHQLLDRQRYEKFVKTQEDNKISHGFGNENPVYFSKYNDVPVINQPQPVVEISSRNLQQLPNSNAYNPQDIDSVSMYQEPQLFQNQQSSYLQPSGSSFVPPPQPHFGYYQQPSQPPANYSTNQQYANYQSSNISQAPSMVGNLYQMKSLPYPGDDLRSLPGYSNQNMISSGPLMSPTSYNTKSNVSPNKAKAKLIADVYGSNVVMATNPGYYAQESSDANWRPSGKNFDERSRATQLETKYILDQQIEENRRIKEEQAMKEKKLESDREMKFLREQQREQEELERLQTEKRKKAEADAKKLQDLQEKAASEAAMRGGRNNNVANVDGDLMTNNAEEEDDVPISSPKVRRPRVKVEDSDYRENGYDVSPPVVNERKPKQRTVSTNTIENGTSSPTLQQDYHHSYPPMNPYYQHPPPAVHATPSQTALLAPVRGLPYEKSSIALIPPNYKSRHPPFSSLYPMHSEDSYHFAASMTTSQEHFMSHGNERPDTAQNMDTFLSNWQKRNHLDGKSDVDNISEQSSISLPYYEGSPQRMFNQRGGNSLLEEINEISMTGTSKFEPINSAIDNIFKLAQDSKSNKLQSSTASGIPIGIEQSLDSESMMYLINEKNPILDNILNKMNPISVSNKLYFPTSSLSPEKQLPSSNSNIGKLTSTPSKSNTSQSLSKLLEDTNKQIQEEKRRDSQAWLSLSKESSSISGSPLLQSQGISSIQSNSFSSHKENDLKRPNSAKSVGSNINHVTTTINRSGSRPTSSRSQIEETGTMSKVQRHNTSRPSSSRIKVADDEQEINVLSAAAVDSLSSPMPYIDNSPSTVTKANPSSSKRYGEIFSDDELEARETKEYMNYMKQNRKKSWETSTEAGKKVAQKIADNFSSKRMLNDEDTEELQEADLKDISNAIDEINASIIIA